MDRNEIVEKLRTGIYDVTFTKLDGTERVMKCTLKEDYFPPYDFKETTRTKSEEVVSVWDMEKHGWRSFRVDSVSDMKFAEYSIVEDDSIVLAP